MGISLPVLDLLVLAASSVIDAELLQNLYFMQIVDEKG